MRNATGSDRVGLEQRLGVLDARIARLETDIDENGRQLSSFEAIRATTGALPPGMTQGNVTRIVDNMVPMVVVFTLFVLCPIALSISRYFWKRGSMPRQSPHGVENTQRLERMEHAIDSIAIEVERVSEGQRFVTRLMAEAKPGVGLPAAQAERVGGQRL